MTAMHKYPLIIFAVAAAAAVLLPPLLTAKPEEKLDAQGRISPDADVQALIEKLGSESYAAREQSTTEVWKLGAKAIPALKKATASEDPELAQRAGELLLYLSAGVMHDSPEEVKTMVMSFAQSTVSQKITTLNKLSRMGKWRQVLLLANLEKDPDARKTMDPLVNKNVIQAARKAIAKSDHEYALEILNLAGNTDKGNLLRAWFYKQSGMLEKQLKIAASMPDKQGAQWRLALHRADGNIPAALMEAQKIDDGDLTKFLTLQSGDPIPWLMHELSESSTPNGILALSKKLQIARLKGNQSQADILAEKLREIAKTPDSQKQVVFILAANGYRKKAMDLLVRTSALNAFLYYDHIQMPEQALQALGVPLNLKPPYRDWVEKTTKHALKENKESAYLPLFQLAGSFARHGMPDHATSVIAPLMNALKEKDPDAWHKYLNFICRLDLGSLAISLIAERGNEDGEADLAVMRMLSKQSSTKESIENLWEALKKSNDQNLGKTLHQMAVLYGVIHDTNNEALPIHNALLAEVDHSPDVEHTARLHALSQAAEGRSDLLTSRDMISRLTKRHPELKATLLRADRGLGKWGIIEPQYAEKVEQDPSNYLYLTDLYIIREKLGKHKNKQAMFRQIMLLSMGEPRALYSIAHRFKQAGMTKQATELWLQAIAMSRPADPHAYASIQYLLEQPDQLFLSKDFKLAAALAEMHCQNLTKGRSRNASISTMLNTQFYASFSRGMNLLQRGNKKQAISELNRAQALIPAGGLLADYFFPNLLGKDITDHYNRWFTENFQLIAKFCQDYPKNHNAHNSAAWLASRAVRKLNAAQEHSEIAVKLRPHQAAYLDTKAEVWFAKGNRSEAIKWSQKAVHATLTRLQGPFRSRSSNLSGFNLLSQQLERFKTAEFPQPR